MKTNYLKAGIFVVLCVLAGCANREGLEQSSVSVGGTGTVLAQPDMAAMNVSVSHIAPTTRQAREVVNTGVRRILDILQESGVEDKNIQSASLRFHPEYEWRNNKNTFAGYRAEQGIRFSVEDIKTSPEKLSAVIDKIALVDKVTLDNMQFDVKDKTALYAQARELAWTKAMDKARHYAQLSGRNVDKVMSISEEDSPEMFAAAGNTLFRSDAAESESSAAATSLPTGELQITARVGLLVFLE